MNISVKHIIKFRNKITVERYRIYIQYNFDANFYYRIHKIVSKNKEI